MERIAKLGALLASSESENPSKDIKSSENIDEVLSGSRYSVRKTQAGEDTKKTIKEWKAKSTINPHILAQHFLGDMYPLYKQMMEFNTNELSLNFNDAFLKTKEEQRVITNQLVVALLKKFPVTPEKYEKEPWHVATLVGVGGTLYPATGTKFAIQFGLYCKTIQILGTEKHHKYLERGLRLADMGCFALTEISHGSNVQGMLTTATFDEVEKCFIINTPIERAAKFWIGGASQTANMAIVGANLIVGGKNHGIHMFVVQIRNTKTHDILPGITIGDCGDKMGLNGIDNGMIFFRNVQAPLISLLDKVTQVSPNGEVTSLFTKSKRFAVQLGGLCDGRVKLLNTCLISGIKASTILLRYAATRRQFGAHLSNESHLLDYEQYQNRVFPHVATNLVSFFAAREVNKLWMRLYNESINPKNEEAVEMHALISVMKPLITWSINDLLIEYRSAMGGWGYHKLSQIPTMIDDYQVMITWEGDNNVLIHQAAKFILKGIFRVLSNRPVSYKSLEYLTQEDPEDIFKLPVDQFEAILTNSDALNKLMSLRARKAATTAALTFQTNLTEIVQSFESWNKSVPFGFLDATIYYGELYVFQTALHHAKSQLDANNLQFLNHLLVIYSLTRFLRSWIHIGQHFTRDHVEAIQRQLLKSYSAIKHDIVSVVDGFALNDDFANSIFGCEDGDMYGKLFSKLNSDRSNFGKPSETKALWENRFSY